MGVLSSDAGDIFPGFESLDQYVDFVVDVMAVANEFLMDKLKWICSVALRDCSTFQRFDVSAVF